MPERLFTETEVRAAIGRLESASHSYALAALSGADDIDARRTTFLAVREDVRRWLDGDDVPPPDRPTFQTLAHVKTYRYSEMFHGRPVPSVAELVAGTPLETVLDAVRSGEALPGPVGGGFRPAHVAASDAIVGTVTAGEIGHLAALLRDGASAAVYQFEDLGLGDCPNPTATHLAAWADALEAADQEHQGE